MIAGSLLVLIAGLSAWLLKDGEAWGALGQWAGALGTVLAVTVALRISQREADAESERRQIEQAERELEQARLVVTIIDYPSVEEELVYSGRFGPEPPDNVRITNYSPTHVFYPRIEGFVHQNGGKVIWDLPYDDPDDYTAPTVLGAGETDSILVSLTYDPPITPDMYPMRTKVIIGFTDAGGRRWRRIAESTPERVLAGDSFKVEGPDWYRAD
ncbi:hypothetical protein ABZX92_44150 [Lentzea sp. NPDC006480]|uniref:hypothetical protein n=1 Tax=Lentzea sp. NPDC006480 TaxID=3157176 RepID=UPI0033AEF8F5